MLRRCRWCRWRPCRLRRTRERRRSLVVDRSRAGGRRTVPDATSIAEYCVLEPLPLEALGEQVLFEGLLVLAITPFRAAALALARAGVAQAAAATATRRRATLRCKHFVELVKRRRREVRNTDDRAGDVRRSPLLARKVERLHHLAFGWGTL